MIGRTSGNRYGQTLRARTRPGVLYERLDGSAVRCTACAHSCAIGDGHSGVCGVRWNKGGTLLTPWGYTSSVACDPVEKKPFYHFLAGCRALSFGMLGCNLHCRFCQNWSISQALRDPDAQVPPRSLTAEELVQTGLRHATPIVASTYNEPLITSEWAVRVFQLARQQGMKTCYISNGFASCEAIEFLDPWLDAANVDLKCFTEEGYRWLGGRLEPVKATIAALRERGKWVEVITLLVPGFNDEPEELKALTSFLAGVSPDIPWHVSAYHADYRMREGPRVTPVESLLEAMEIGRQAGLRYVYAGNVRGDAGGSHTHCHGCGSILIERTGFGIRKNRLAASGACPDCGTTIPGVWNLDDCAERGPAAAP